MKIGIIGGSGLDDPQLLQSPVIKNVTTPYGEPSSPLTFGTIADVEVVLLSRHGLHHQYSPTEVNYRANILALKDAGCTHILATTAVGSLREEIKRGDFVILDQFIDFTRRRELSFYSSFASGAVHTPMATPFDSSLRATLFSAAQQLGFSVHARGTVVTIEGPRFSTRAESHLFRVWGADVINMSIAPECALANELKIPYAAVAMPTDYDCWKEDEAPVSWDAILSVFQANVVRVKELLVATLRLLAPVESSLSLQLRSKIRTIADWPKPGILFRDVTSLLQDPSGFSLSLADFVARYKDQQLHAIVGIDSRGFIFGAALAYALGLGFIPVRKKGKLPGVTERCAYALEYGTDVLEIHADALSSGQSVLIVDDLLATGGTALAAVQLVQRLGATVLGCAFVVDLPDLGGGKKLAAAGISYYAQTSFSGH